MIGYHYTSEENWKKIQKEGLLPRKIDRPEWLYLLGVTSVTGVWVWQNKLEGLSHAGTVIYQMATKATTRVVMLKVEYNVDDVFKIHDKEVNLKHKGEIQKLIYHYDEEAFVVKQIIPPENIELLQVFDLVDALKIIEW